MATHSSILAWKIAWTMDGGAWHATPPRARKELDTTERLTHTQSENPLLYVFSS